MKRIEEETEEAAVNKREGRIRKNNASGLERRNVCSDEGT
jgi:hypothetical protein